MAEVKAVVTFTDYQALISVMRQINPALVRAFRKNQRQIAGPVVRGIRDGLGQVKPHRGMVTKVGRLSWSMTMNQSKDIQSVVVRDRKRKPRSTFPVIGIIQARTLAAPVGIYDMAGRSRAYINSKDETREYDYTGPQRGKPAGQLGRRKHKIRNQGLRMIEMLGGRGSRFVYPAAEKQLPEVRMKLQIAVNQAVNEVNSMLRRI